MIDLTRQAVRDEAFGLALEATRWLGQSVLTSLQSLRQAQVQTFFYVVNSPGEGVSGSRCEVAEGDSCPYSHSPHPGPGSEPSSRCVTAKY